MIGLPDAREGGRILAQIAVIAVALSYAFAGVYGRRFKAMGVNPTLTAAGQVTASTHVMIPIALTVDSPLDNTTQSMETWASMNKESYHLAKVVNHKCHFL